VTWPRKPWSQVRATTWQTWCCTLVSSVATAGCIVKGVGCGCMWVIESDCGVGAHAGSSRTEVRNSVWMWLTKTWWQGTLCCRVVWLCCSELLCLQRTSSIAVSSKLHCAMLPMLYHDVLCRATLCHAGLPPCRSC
jgi:hypothetical protein